MMSSNPLISVIIPVYNVEDYLDECLKSVCNQTYENIQIILVDDGSTDSSGTICDKYCKADNRVSVIHKQNGGLVSARKAGIPFANGEYVSFVDSDDWIDNDMYEKLCELCKNNSFPDVISFGMVEEYPDHINIIGNNIPAGIYSRENMLKNDILMTDNFFQWKVQPHLCGKIIKIKLLKEALLQVSEKIVFGEDVACSYPCLLSANTFLSVDFYPYHYRQREGSIVKALREYDRGNFICIFERLKDKIDAEQLKCYMFFILCLKSYSKIGSSMPLFPFSEVTCGSNVFVYGAGGFGKVIHEAIIKGNSLSLSGWTDKNFSSYRKAGYEIDDFDELFRREYDYIVVAILNEKLTLAIKKELVDKGIPAEKILPVRKDIILESPLPEWLYK